MVRVRVRIPRRGSVRVRTPSRVGVTSGVFSVGGLSPGELSPGGYLYKIQIGDRVMCLCDWRWPPVPVNWKTKLFEVRQRTLYFFRIIVTTAQYTLFISSPGDMKTVVVKHT